MVQLIDKAAVVAEIEKRIANYKAILVGINQTVDDDWVDSSSMLEAKIDTLQSVLHFLDTLEVKEVDLEKELDEWYSNGFPNEEELLDYIEETAKHFFELGLKAQKGD